MECICKMAIIKADYKYLERKNSGNGWGYSMRAWYNSTGRVELTKVTAKPSNNIWYEVSLRLNSWEGGKWEKKEFDSKTKAESYTMKLLKKIGRI